MFMVASSVVTTIMILNYHHRQADTHEMPSWVSSSSSRALSRSKYTRSYSGFVIIPSAVCLYLSELFSSIKFWKWESDAKKRTRTYSMPLSSWKLKCPSRECGRYPPYLHTIQFWAKTLFLRLPSPGTTSDSAGKDLSIKTKIKRIIWVCWKIQSLNFHAKSNAKYNKLWVYSVIRTACSTRIKCKNPIFNNVWLHFAKILVQQIFPRS